MPPVIPSAALSSSAASGGLRFLPLSFPSLSIRRRRKPSMLSPPPLRYSSSPPPPPPGEDSSPSRKPWLLVGLGNPGKIYQGTRHNVGFEMLDAIAEAEGISLSSIKFKAIFGKGFIGNVPIMLAKPQTFMNASGESVGSLVSYFHIPLNQVLLMYDDMDLPFAKLRMLPKGGHGGHNGMRSVIKHLKDSRDFPRLKIGIGRPPGKMDPVNFVLRPFNKKEKEELDFTFQRGMEAMRILVLEGFSKSATFANSATPSELLNR
ncbi:putative peptidyl-tRNA hydrolase, mitochondrial [Iris pallida]|uniref:peptidyl-tRNA hydrolase n=1 Tax=Iris pallida TaxID=29817 RepID=A0AAX6DY68_IRIPA|nr:putative peptidyl-tRNA hydrolase, mitochondrial [Iris pallida]KAJ6799150.1 putative peptidyl-tRNA hydrolase, mitochondrial [Iris pallida]